MTRRGAIGLTQRAFGEWAVHRGRSRKVVARVLAGGKFPSRPADAILLHPVKPQIGFGVA